MLPKMIALNPETKERLTREGRMGETYDMLMRRLLDELHRLRNGKKG